MSGDNREFQAEQWDKGCRNQVIFWIVVFLITHSIAFLFGVIAGKLIYG